MIRKAHHKAINNKFHTQFGLKEEGLRVLKASNASHVTVTHSPTKPIMS